MHEDLASMDTEKPRLHLSNPMAALEIGALLLFATILAFQLIAPPIVGLADNRDFDRIMKPVGLAHISDDFEDNFFNYVNRHFALVPAMRQHNDYLSTQTLLVRSAIGVDNLVSRDDLFDLRSLGAFNLMWMAVGFGLVIRASRCLPVAMRLAVFVAFIFVFADVAYVAYLNSLYSEAAGLIFFILMVGFGLLIISSQKPKIWMLVAFFLCSILLVGSKPQYAPLGIPLAYFGYRLSSLSDARWWKGSAVGASILVLLFSYWYVRQTPDYMREANVYNVVFFEILPHSPDPEADLRFFDLDPSLSEFSGTTAYLPDVPIYEQSYYGKVGFRKINSFYLAHPDRLFDLVLRASDTAFQLRHSELGNFEESAGFGRRAQSDGFDAWSEIRSGWIANSAITPLLILGALVVGIVFLHLPNARVATLPVPLRDFFTLLALMALLSYVTAVVGEGEYELVKHMFLFNAIVDAIFIGILVLGLVFLTERLGNGSKTAPRS